MEEDRPFIDSLKGMRIGGRYVVDKVLGSGGMGVVATAKYPELHQKVAIKFLRPAHASNGVLNARFVREARLAARVKSEHFVRVFDIGKLPSGIPYLVMELLTGHDLADELIEKGPLGIEPALEWVLQSLVGLAEIHALGVVHRDLKPSNLFISEAAGKRMVKVLDFGISKENAKADGAALTATDNLLGTPQYMSPEQVRASKDVDERSDIWAVGVILYELLTGKRPFVSDENATGELFAKVLYIDPLPPRDHRPELPVELEAVILKCLQRDREARYPDVLSLAEALRPFVPASTGHLFDAVKQAAATKKGSIAPPGDDDEETDEAARPLSQLETTSSSPNAKRSSGSNKDAADQAPVTAMTSATGSRAREPKSASKKPLFAVLGVGAVIGIAAFVISSSRSTPPAPAPLVAAPPPPATSAPAPVVSTPVPATAETVSAPEPAVSSAPVAVATPAHVTGVTAPRPKPSAAPKPSTGTGSLIEDRK